MSKSCFRVKLEMSEVLLRGIEWSKSLGVWNFGPWDWDPWSVGPWDLFFIHESFWKSCEVREWPWGGGLVGCWLEYSITSLLVLFLVFWLLYRYWKVVGWVVGGCIWIMASALVLFWPGPWTMTMTRAWQISFINLNISIFTLINSLTWTWHNWHWPCFMLPWDSRVGWWISEGCADRVIIKHLYIETTVQKDFAQNSIFWKINFKLKIPYLRN